KWNAILDLEQEKLLYFILAYPQKLVLVKTGEKAEEKRFLGYEFSNRRGSEGIHPIQRGKFIDECTQLFDADAFDNPEKASTYIYKAFQGEFDLDIPEILQKNVSYQNLVDMLSFDRVTFEKNVSLVAKKKVKIESRWEVKRLDEVSTVDYGTRIVRKKEEGSIYPVYGGGGETFKSDSFNRENCFIISRFGMSPETVRFVSGKFFLNDSGMTINATHVNQKYLDFYLFSNQDLIYDCGRGVAQKNIDIDAFNSIPIPLPPLDIQQKIVSEIEVLEKKEEKTREKVEELRKYIIDQANKQFQNHKLTKLSLVSEKPLYGANEKAVSGDPSKDYRYIRITDINDDGTLNSDWRTAENVEEKYILNDGDFLFARSGATAGKTFLYKKEYGKALYAGYLIKFPIKEDVLISTYLNFVLKGDIYRRWVLEKRVGVAQPNINALQYSSFEIPLPTLSEQEKIVSEIEKIETQIEALENEIAEIPKQKESILKKWLN
ncbi:MAG TPA: restriction endonuclease subunit S, partial [Treponemataceae bacterium]|nr:restriction endonuclease subunit S [Treponemataceae bacterium]